MRATALLQRLPHAASAERPRRARRRRHRLGKPATAIRAAELSPAPPVVRRDASGASADPGSAGSLIPQRARLAGGPIDNASYTCACGFVFAASVSTTVACPHCGADQAW